MMGKAAQTPGLSQVFSLFETSTPQLYLDIDRTKAQLLGINVPTCSPRCRSISARPTSTTSTCSAAPSASPRRPTPNRAWTTKDVLAIRVRNSSGDTVPLGSFTTVRDISGPVSRAALQPLSRRRARRRRRARLQPGPGDGRSWRSSPRRRCRTASATNGPRWRSSNCAPATPRSSPSCWRWCSCSWCSPRSSRA